MDTNNYGWLIPSLKSSTTQQDDWDQRHENYAENVLSITEDPKLCERLIQPSAQIPGFDIPNSSEIKVLIPGCGSEIYLQKALLEACPNIGEVYCTDFSKVAVEKAQEKWQQAHGDRDRSYQQFVFAEVDSTQITTQKPDWQNKFNYVLVVNSVLSGDDAQNRQMIHEFAQVLKPGGRLYGYFPSIFCLLEATYLDQSMAYLLTTGALDLPHSAFSPPAGGDRQIYYTPMRLNKIFREAGFRRLNFEIFMGDSDILRKNIKDSDSPLYEDPDFFEWSFLVRYEKPA